MDTSLAAVIDLYLFPTGRRLFAHTQVLRRAQAAKHTDLVKHCQAAMAHDRACLDLERRWAGVAGEARRKARPGAAPENDAVRLDALVDRTLTAIRDHAESQAAGAAPDDPIHAQERLLETVALILGKHHGRTPEDVTARAELLAPILEQNAAIGAAMKRRRSVEDVDPDSGVPDPSAPAGAPEPPER